MPITLPETAAKTKRCWSLLATGVLMLGLSPSSLSADETADQIVLTEAVLREAAAPLVEADLVEGVSIGFIQGQRSGTVHLGQANQAGDMPDDKTIYELGSISKVFTGILLADAVSRGRIDLQSPAGSEAGGFTLPTKDDKPITWLNLSTHRSGMPRLPANMIVRSHRNPYADYDSKRAAEAIDNMRLKTTPGTNHLYSNFAVSVLGHLIGCESDTDYPQLLQQRITVPLGLDDCTIALTADQESRLAAPHRSIGKPTPPWDFADLPGAGGIRASLADMLKFAAANLNPDATDGEVSHAIELAWKQHVPADRSGPAMGLGWIIATDGETRWHNGATGGSRTAIFLNRDSATAVVILTNTAAGSVVDDVARDLVRRSTGKSPRKLATKTFAKEQLNRLAGRYELASNFVFNVKFVGDRMFVGITNQQTQEVFPDSKTRWSYRSVKATLEFKLNEAGPAHSLVLHQNGIKQTAKRIPGDTD